MFPRLLNEEQMQRCVQVFHDILERMKTEPDLLRKVVTSDESLTFEYDPLTKRQSLECKNAASPRPKKARRFKFKVKVVLIAFFDEKGVLYMSFFLKAPFSCTICLHRSKFLLFYVRYNLTDMLAQGSKRFCF